jgi:sugar-specific transcriptional regulator TrmB
MLVVNKETLALLRRLGLNQYESKTYLALVNTDSATATELSDMASIPRPRVYDVLAKLEKKGFVITKPGRPTKYNAVKTNAAIAALKREREDVFKREVTELEKLEQKLVETIGTNTVERASGEEVFVINDRRNIYSTIGDLIDRAKTHVVLHSHKEGLMRKREEYGAQLHRAMKRGVRVDLIEGTKRFAVIDDHTFLFLNDPQDPKNDKAAWIKSPFVANAFRC